MWNIYIYICVCVCVFVLALMHMMLHRWVFVGILEAFVGQGLEQFAKHHEVVRGCCETDTVSWHKASSKRQHGCQNFGVPPEWNNTYNTRTVSNGWRLCLYEMKSLRLRLCFWLRCDVIWYSVNQFDTDCLIAIDRHAHLQHDRIWYMILKPVSMHKFINIYIHTLCVCARMLYRTSQSTWRSKQQELDVQTSCQCRARLWASWT